MTPFARFASAVRSAAARAFGQRLGAGGIVARRPDRRPLRELAPGVGAWDRAFEEVQTSITAHEAGRFRASSFLSDALDRSARIVGALNNRTLGVIGSPFSVLPGLGDRRRAASVARYAEEDFATMVDEATIAAMLADMTKLGLSLARVRVVTVRGRWIPVVEHWHAGWLRWDDTTDRFLVQTRTGEVVVTPGDGWFLLAASRSRPWMRGVVRCLGLPAEVRKYASRDWSRWSEKHGLPLVELQVPAAKSESDEAVAFFDQMRELASETTIVSPQGDGDQASFKVNLIEARDTAWEGFKELIARADGDVSIAIEGQNLSTENQSTGARASSETGHSIRQDLREADAWVLASALHEQLLRPWALWNFGDAALAPWAVWDPTPPEDLKTSAETMKAAGEAIAAWRTIAQSSGRDVDVIELAERFGVPLVQMSSPASASPTSSAAVDADEDTTPEEARARASARRFLARRRRALRAP